MKNRQIFSLSLIEAREKLRLTQPEMAERLGIEIRQYVNYEKGKYDDNEKITKKYMLRLLDVMKKFDNLQKVQFSQTGNITPALAEMQRQIDLINGKITRIMDRLGMV